MHRVYPRKSNRTIRFDMNIANDIYIGGYKNSHAKRGGVTVKYLSWCKEPSKICILHIVKNRTSKIN
jgi:hypothetical protein